MRIILCAVFALMVASIAVSDTDTSNTRSVSNSAGTMRVQDKLMGPTSSRERRSTDSVDTIMLPFCSAVTVSPEKPYDINWMVENFTSYSASAHYLIDRDGLVYRLVDEKRAAFHAGRGEMPWGGRVNTLNQSSIGIEMFA